MQPDTLQTYTGTVSTMSRVLETVRDEPDPDGAITILADRIAAEREWVRALMALEEEPRRPPGWLRPVDTALRGGIGAGARPKAA